MADIQHPSDSVPDGAVGETCCNTSLCGDGAHEGGGALGIERLIVEHHAVLYRYAYRLCGSCTDAEDLTQQAFLVAHRKLHQLRERERARSWLFAVLRTCFLKSRRRPQEVPASGLELSIDALPERVPEHEEIDCERLQAAISALPQEFRVVVLMFYFEQLSYKEIAAQLDIRIGTVMSRLARAKDRLRYGLLAADASGCDPEGSRPLSALQWVKPAVRTTG